MLAILSSPLQLWLWASTDPGPKHRSVFAIRDAARELGVSVSTLHKLIKQRQLGHLKVGARTLMTAEHLAQFLEASEVQAPATQGDVARTREPAAECSVSRWVPHESQ